MMKKHHYVYRITRIHDGAFYIGVHSTDDIDDGYMGSGLRIKKSILAHGRDAHRREILHVFDSQAEAYAREAELVNNEILNEELCLNIKAGGFGGTGTKHTVETKAKIAEASRTRVWSEESRKRMSNAQRGKYQPPHTDETKQKMSVAHTGKIYNMETRRKIAENSRNISEETRKKRSDSAKIAWARKRAA